MSPIVNRKLLLSLPIKFTSSLPTYLCSGSTQAVLTGFEMGTTVLSMSVISQVGTIRNVTR